VKTDEIKNILIFKPGAIGDLLHLTPVIRELNSKFPDARISIMVGSTISVDIFRNNPLVHQVIIFNKKGEHRSLSAVANLWSRLRSNHFDLVINYQRSNIKGWVLMTAAFPCRVLVYHKTRRTIVHAIVDHLQPLAGLGVDPHTADQRLDFFPLPMDEEYADRFISEHNLAGKRLIAFNPGTSHASKCWPIERFAALGDRLASEYGCEIVVVGSSFEVPLATAIRNGMQHPIHDLCGCTLGELGALLKRTEFLVTGDTGPMHIASAVGTRVLALYGPISPERSGPVGVGHRIAMHAELDCCPCNRFDCKNRSFRLCMEMITVDEVMQIAKEMLHNRVD
jgi:heptosyltransferase-2